MENDKEFLKELWIEFLWMNLNKTVQLLKAHFKQEAKSLDLNILPEQWEIIFILSQRQTLTQVEIAKFNHKHTPSVSKTIDILCERGYTERKPFENDKRKYQIHLTNKGKELVDTLFPKILPVREKSWEGLNRTDFDHLVRILTKIQDNLGTVSK